MALGVKMRVWDGLLRKLCNFIARKIIAWMAANAIIFQSKIGQRLLLTFYNPVLDCLASRLDGGEVTVRKLPVRPQ